MSEHSFLFAALATYHSRGALDFPLLAPVPDAVAPESAARGSDVRLMLVRAVAAPVTTPVHSSHSHSAAAAAAGASSILVVRGNTVDCRSCHFLTRGLSDAWTF
jgi:hypothetical protein